MPDANKKSPRWFPFSFSSKKTKQPETEDAKRKQTEVVDSVAAPDVKAGNNNDAVKTSDTKVENIVSANVQPPAEVTTATPIKEPVSIAATPAGVCPFGYTSANTKSNGSGSDKKKTPESSEQLKKSEDTHKKFVIPKEYKEPVFEESDHSSDPYYEELKTLMTSAKQITNKDIVYIKEGWNKALAFRSRLFFEAISERWFFLRSNVLEGLGLEAEDMCGFIYGWLDLIVHSFQPETEILHRESYQPLHIIPGQRFYSPERYALQFVIRNVKPQDMIALEEAWYFALTSHTPYFQEEDNQALADRENAPLVRMFRICVFQNYLNAINKMEQTLNIIPPISRAFAEISAGREMELGRKFYVSLFTPNPDLIDFFSDTDMDSIATHLMVTVGIVLASSQTFHAVMPALESLAAIHRRFMIPTWAYAIVSQTMLAFFKEELGVLFTEAVGKAIFYVVDIICSVVAFPHYLIEKESDEAVDFFNQAAEYFSWSPNVLNQRKLKAMREIYATGTHQLTSDELEFGARLAWRNSAKCVGRISWNTLQVRDCRNVEDPVAIFKECVEHQRIATAGTNLQSVMTVFRARPKNERWGIRIWNSQLVRFACWQQADGTTLGDPANGHLTAVILKIYPKFDRPESERTGHDVLPVVIQLPGEEPVVFEPPPEARILVDIEHPENAAVKAFGYKWCAVPTITNFNMRIAGIDYTCCPFNGWFMDLEVTRNLHERYGASDKFIEVFPDLLARKNAGDNTWMESIYVEISRAVLYSFKKSKMTIVDKATSAQQFETHCTRERELGKEVAMQWSWIGGMLGPIYSPWGREGRDFMRNPQYEYEADIYLCAPHKLLTEGGECHSNSAEGNGVEGSAEDIARANVMKILRKGVPTVTILYGSETGTAEMFARACAKELQLLNPHLCTMNAAAMTTAGRNRLLSDILLVITSTFGDGLSPTNASVFFDESVYPIPDLTRKNDQSGNKPPVKLSVCAIGSSVYPKFVQFGRKVHYELKNRGADQLIDIVTADEMAGQQSSVYAWIDSAKKNILPPSLEAALKFGARPPPIILLRPGVKSDNDPAASIAASTTSPFEFIQKLANAPYALDGHTPCPVILNKELRKAAKVELGASTKRVDIDISAMTAAGITYETGDHVSVVPIRSPAQVLTICESLRVAPSDKFELVECFPADENQPTSDKNGSAAVVGEGNVSPSKPATSESTPRTASESMIQDEGSNYIVKGLATVKPFSSLTWAELFLYTAETNILPYFAGPLVNLLVKAATRQSRDVNVPVESSAIMKKLETLSESFNTAAGPAKGLKNINPKYAVSVITDDDVNDEETNVEQENEELKNFPKTMNEFIDKYVSLGPLFTAFPGLAARIDLAQLIVILPRPKPRFYSISSSSITTPNTVGISVGLMLEKTSMGSTRRGVCSGYLNTVEVGSLVLVSVRNSSFKLPEDCSTPIICAGPGTGFAPFAGFLDHRLTLSQQTDTEGKNKQLGNALVFTGARYFSDVIYEEEIQSAWSKDNVAKLYQAISQEGNKQRIQAIMSENASEIVKTLVDEGGHFYCCGDARVADDISESMVMYVSKEKGISKLAANLIVNRLSEEGRIHLDCWGVVNFFTQGSDRFNAKRSNTAKNWLATMQSQ